MRFAFSGFTLLLGLAFFFAAISLLPSFVRHSIHRFLVLVFEGLESDLLLLEDAAVRELRHAAVRLPDRQDAVAEAASLDSLRLLAGQTLRAQALDLLTGAGSLGRHGLLLCRHSIGLSILSPVRVVVSALLLDVGQQLALGGGPGGGNNRDHASLDVLRLPAEALRSK